MKTSVERVDDTTVKLSVTVEPERVRAAVDAAARKLGGEVKIPGFRPGHVPRRVLEARLGKGTLLEEAAREALPGFYAEAVREAEVEVVGPPELDLETFSDTEETTFTATVEVRPEIEVPDYRALQIPHPEWEVTEEELGRQLDDLRDRFAELSTVDRSADVGDYAVITVTGERGGERVDEASGEDLLYLVRDPSESDSELDRQLIGASAGAMLKFTDTLGADYPEGLAGAEVNFSVLVKEVKRKELPALDDDFAITASEYDTIDELRAGLEEQLGRAKRAQARALLRGRVVEAVTGLVDVPLPKSLVDEEVRFRLLQLSSEAGRHGIELDQYLAATGTDPQQLVARLEQDARHTVRAQLVLDAIGRAEGIEVSGDDLSTEIARQAARLDRPPEELVEYMTHPDRVGVLLGDAFRRKTIDHLLEHVQVLSAPPDEPEEEPVGGDDLDPVHGAAAAIAAAEAEAADADEEADGDGAVTNTEDAEAR